MADDRAETAWRGEWSASVMAPRDSPLKTPPFAAPSPSVLASWLAVFIALGVGWRTLRYALGFPFWGDEAYVAINLLHRDYVGLLQPLEYQQIAAPLWLWCEKAVFDLLGGGEYALRFPSLVFGLAGIAAFVALARSQLEGRAAVLAVAIFASTYYLARESAEVKPYAADTLVSTLILLAATRWMQRPGDLAPPWVTAGLAGCGIWLSYPAVFTASGVSLALLVPAVRNGRRGVIAWLSYSAAVTLSFAAFFLLVAGRQASSVADSWLEDYWRGAFPPIGDPAALLRWIIEIHTGLMFAYPVGAENGGSALTTVAFLVGVAALLRTGRWRLTALLLAPFAMTFVAAALERYPYGKSFRVAAFLAPSICLLVGAGGAAALQAIRAIRWREGLAGLLGLALVGLMLGGMTADVLTPYKRVEDARMRAAMRALVARLAPRERVTALNSPFALPANPSCPRFDPVMYYYFERYSGRRLLWREGDHVPESEWLLAYYQPGLGADGAPALARVLTSQRFELHATVALGTGKRLEIYRVRADR